MGSEQTRVCHLNVLPALDGPGASDLENLSRCGEVHPLGCLDGLDGAPHPPPVAGVDARDGRDLLPGQVLERPAQSLLVAFDGEHVVAALIADPPGGVHLCVHGVGGDHYPVEVEGLEKLPDGGDLVGLVGYPGLGQHGARGVVQGRQEVRRRGLPQAGPAHGLAVHRDDCSSLDGAGTSAQPRPQTGVEVGGVQALQHPPDGRLRRQGPRPRPRDTPPPSKQLRHPHPTLPPPPGARPSSAPPHRRRQSTVTCIPVRASPLGLDG